jgi:alkylation response protein AidB-like acyl-CoA dehydrogenase
MRQDGVEVRPLIQITGEHDFNEVYLDGARVPDRYRIGAEGEGWKVANSTLSGERQMVAGPGSGGVDRIGGSGVDRLIALAHERGVADDRVLRQRLAELWSLEKIRRWTNARVRDNARAGRVGPESSIGKITNAEVNIRTQELAVDLLGAGALAWDGAPLDFPREVFGFLRSRANTIEGGTSEVNRNVVGERVLGLPREPDPYLEASWQDTPRS